MLRQPMMFSKGGLSAAEVQTLINASIGGDQMDFVETCQPWQIGANANTANRATFFRVRVARAITVSQMTVFVGTASGNIDLGIYQSDGTTLTKIAATGSTAAAGANATQTVNLTAAVTLLPGIDYYFAFSSDNATVTVGRWVIPANSVGGFKKRVMRVDTAFPLPATQALASTVETGLCWWIAAA